MSPPSLIWHLQGDVVKTPTTIWSEVSDAELVGMSLSGHRHAFGQIVTRYQTLICSLAYNATGNLAKSEDLLQETFLAAWKQLSKLREPDERKSKSILSLRCGSPRRGWCSQEWLRFRRIHGQLFPNASEKVHTATAGTMGKAEFAFAPIKSFSIGGCLFHDLEAALSLQTAGVTANKYGDGIAGAELFLKSAVVFDYNRQRIIVERHNR